MSIEAMKMALESLDEIHRGNMTPMAEEAWNRAITALRQAIEQAEHVHAVNTSQERVDEIVKQEHDRAVELAQAYKRGWKAALAQQEPVAWLKTWSDGSVSVLKTKSYAFADRELEPLYAAPPKKEWVSLTDEEVSEVIDNVLEGGGWLDVARVLEQAFKEKNA